MKIAIVGAGISGLVCGHLLRRSHEVTIFEANDYIGGHTHTHAIDIDAGRQYVDSGFIVFNTDFYPNFTRLLSKLNVESQETAMSLSVRCDESGLEYAGRNLNSLFAQRGNLFNWRYHRMLRDILRFQKQGAAVVDTLSDQVSVKEFIERHQYSQEFLRWFLIPMGSALWSAPAGEFLSYPIRFIIQFFRNHGMMQLIERTPWRVIKGGSFRYVEKLTAGWRDRIRLLSPVGRVERLEQGVRISLASGTEDFDEVIFACHSDQALRMLEAPDFLERETLGSFPYQENLTVLHTDETLLPVNRRAWGCWNYHLGKSAESAAAVTYNMTMLQSLPTERTFCVSLNETGIAEDKVLRRMQYHHPVFKMGREAMQARHPQLIRRKRTSYCGAYWGFGFHEDGVRSAVAVCEAYGEKL